MKHSKKRRQDKDIKRCKKCRRVWEEVLLTQNNMYYQSDASSCKSWVCRSCLPKKYKISKEFFCIKKCIYRVRNSLKNNIIQT